MKPMTVEQRAALAAALTQQNPAAPELVHATVGAAAGVIRSGFSGAAVGRMFAGDVRAVAARLLAVEDELANVREAVARHVAAADVGHDPTPGDLLADLTGRGCAIDADALDAARAFHTAQAVTW